MPDDRTCPDCGCTLTLMVGDLGTRRWYCAHCDQILVIRKNPGVRVEPDPRERRPI